MPGIIGMAKSIYGFDPQSIGGCSLWLDGADSNSMTFGAGSNISTWADKSGKGANASLYSSAAPVFTPNAFGGRSAPVFNNSPMATQGARLSTDSTMSAFVVFQARLVANPGYNIDFLYATAGYQLFDLLLDGNSSGLYFVFNNAGGDVVVSPVVGRPFIISIVSDGIALKLYVNGTLVQTRILGSVSGSYNPNVTTGWFVGTNTYSGALCEILMYGSAMSSAQRQSIEGYLAWKWGVEDTPQALLVPGISPRNILNIPTSIGGCVLWCDASQGSLQNLATTDTPQGRLATTTTGVTKNNGKNGLGTVTFTTSQIWRASPTFELFAYTMFWVGRQTGGTNGRVLNGTDNYNQLYGYWAGNKRQLHTSSWNSGPYGYPSDTQWDMFSHSRIAGGAFTFKWNGASHATGSSSSGNPLHGLTINAGDYGDQSDCEVGEIILYNSVLTSLQIQEIETYLSKKWDIAIPTPVASQPSGLSLWLDGADPAGNGTVPANGATVSTWVDKSGNGNNGTSTGTPTYALSARSVSFNGSSTFQLPNSTITPGASTFTIFVVCRPTSLANYPYLFFAGIGAASTSVSLVFYPDGSVENGFWTDYMGVAPAGSVSANNTYLFSSAYNGASRTLFRNGTSIVTGSPTGTKNIGAGNNIVGGGGGTPFSGTISEMIVFNTTLTSSHRQQVEAYLATKWGVALGGGYTPLLSSPAGVPGCALWLDASDPSTITLSGTNVTQMRDKSPNGYVFTGASGSYPVQTTTLNGLPVISSSAGKYLTTTNFNQNFSSATFFMIIRPTQDLSTFGVNYPPLSVLQPTTEGVIQYGMSYEIGGLLFFVYFNRSGTAIVNATNLPNPTNKPFFLSGVCSSATSNYMNINGTPVTTSINNAVTLGTFTNQTMYALGLTSGGYSYDFAETLLFGGELNSTQRQSVERYLSLKWGLSNVYTSIPGSISGLALWLDAADPAATGTGDICSTWLDKSVTGNHFTNVGGQCSNIVDGPNRVVRFPNTACMLSSSNITFTTSSAFYFVFKITGYNVLDYVVDFPNIVTNNQQAGDFSIRFGPSILYGANGVGDASSLGNGTYWINGIFNSYSGPYSNVYMMVGTLQPTVGGTTTMALSLPPATTSSNYSGRYFIGNFAEALFYPNGLNTSQREVIESYLARKWGLVVPNNILPISHPFTSIRPFSRQFNPADIEGCQLWLDAADNSTLLQTNGVPVTTVGNSIVTWVDKSGNRYNATANGTPATYGTNAVVFAGAQNYGTALSSTLLTQSGFAVVSYTGSSKMNIFSVNSISGSAGLQQIIQSGSQIITSYGGGTVVTGGAVPASTVVLYNYTFNSGVNAFVYLNGTQTGTSTGVTISGTGTISIGSYNNNGAAEPFVGNMYELLLYDTVLSSSQRQAVEGYLSQKWNIRASLPATHQFVRVPPSSALPFLPTNIANCFLWLDAADPSSMTLSGTNVINWRDKSGNGYLATSQLTPATLVSSSFGGNTTLLFNGSSRYFCPTAAISNILYTIFTVQNTTSGSGGGSSFGYQRVINADKYAFVGVSNGYVATFTGTGSAWNDTDASLPRFYNVNANTIVSMSVTDTLLTPNVNGLEGAIKSGTTGVFSNFYIGDGVLVTGTQPWIGNINEIIVYNGILSKFQRQQVEGYLAWKWGLSARLLHPIITGYSDIAYGPGWTAYTISSTASGGTLTVPSGKTITVDYLVVGGGGGASGYIGGGGGGGYYSYATSVLFTSGIYRFVIGSGGIGQIGTDLPVATGGGNSTIVKAGVVIATGPGGGGAAPVGGLAGSSGPFTGGSYNNDTINSGGGAGAAGNGANGGVNGGNGGDGILNSITGTPTYYGGGGGGGWYTGNVPGTGGRGGGASGAVSYNPSTTYVGGSTQGGGGGGATGGGSARGGPGGGGCVVIRIYS